MRKALLIATIGISIFAAAVFVFRGQLANLAMQIALQRNIGIDATASLPDGLHVILCGSGSPMPDPTRAGPYTAVVAGKSLFVINAGSGGARNLLRMRMPVGAIRSVFLTHFHSDHLDGLGEMGMLRWVSAANQMPLPVAGPTGVEQVVAGFNQAYSADAGYRTAHHGPELAPPSGAGLIAKPFIVPSAGASISVWEGDGVKIAAFAVDHRPVTPSVGYKIEYGGRAVVISGDTRKSEVVAYMAKGADLLVHEGLSPELVGNLERAAKVAGLQSMERIAHDIPSYHTTPIQAAETAAAAGVSALLFTHVVPGWALPGLEVIYLRGVSSVFSGTVMVGKDGTVASMPSGNKQIKFLKFM